MEDINELNNITINETKEYTVGELITRVSRKNKDSKITEIYSVTNDRGIIKSSEIEKFKSKKKSLEGYNVIKKGEICYNAACIKIGSIGQMNDEEGLVCGLYDIFKLNNNIILNDYFLYLIKCNYVHFQIKQLITHTGRDKFRFNNWNKIKIKIPSLETQQKIVSILDKTNTYYNDVNDGLLKEYNLLEKQFKFYLNKLLGLDGLDNNDIYVYKLEEIAKLYDGTHHSVKYLDSGIKFASVENIDNPFGTNKYISEEYYNNNFKNNKIELNNILMTRIGTIGKCYVVDKTETLAYFVSLALIKLDNSKLLSKYLKFYIESNYGKKELFKQTLHSAFPIKINKNNIGYIKVHFPKSLDKQQKIVDILDKFSQLKNQLKNQLKIEIELRNKQFKYYLNKLLTFENI